MDIDIDVPSKFDAMKTFTGKVVRASRIENETILKHNVGVYFQNIPTDLITGLAAIPYDKSEEYGYFKMDIIANSAIDDFESKAWMDEYIEIEPNWNLLLERENVEKLFHLSKQFDVVYAVKPKSILEIADILALIRKNKIKLLDKYLQNKKAIRKELYTHREGADMRKPHALAYALIIVLQLHLIEMGKL
jgi:hypothetical protein